MDYRPTFEHQATPNKGSNDKLSKLYTHHSLIADQARNASNSIFMMNSNTNTPIRNGEFNQTCFTKNEYESSKLITDPPPLDERMFIYSETKTQKMSPEKEIIQYPSQMHEYKYIEPEERSKIMASTKEVINKSSKLSNETTLLLNNMLQKKLNDSGLLNNSTGQDSNKSFFQQRFLTTIPQKVNWIGVPKSDQSLPAPLKKNITETVERRQELIRSGNNHSSIRDRLPRGQTRKLASFFESMEKNAKVQMVLERDRLSSVRSKSVPTRNDFSLENRSSAVFFRKDAESKKMTNDFAITNVNWPKMHAKERDFIALQNQMTRSAYQAQVEDAKNKNSDRNVNPRVNLVTDSNRDSSSKVEQLNKVGNLESNYQKHAEKHSHHANNCPCRKWDQHQYELGVLKAFTDLKRYDSDYKRRTKENFSKDFNYNCLENRREINDIPLSAQDPVHAYAHPSDEKTAYRCRSSFSDSKKQQFISINVDDHIAEVDKAFDFVHYDEPAIDLNSGNLPPHMSSPSEVKDSSGFIDKFESVKHDQETQRFSTSGKDNLQYSVSIYRKHEKDHLNPQICSSSISSKIASEKNSVQEVFERESADMRSTNPMATSTPLESSPSLLSSTKRVTSQMLNDSFDSIISTSYFQNYYRQHDFITKEIVDAIAIQEDEIIRARNEIIRCKKHCGFSGNLTELNAQRTLLLARERLMVLQNELRRIQGILNKPAKPSKCGRVYFDINSVTVYLNRNFCTKSPHETQSYAFVVLFKCEKQVEATQMATLMCTSVLRISEVHFNDHIRFENILDSSSILLEVYAMKIREFKRFNDYSCKVLKNKAKSLLSPSKRNTMKDSCDMLEFTFCGHAFINCRISGNRKFYLDGTVYPLEGTVDVRIYCTSLPPNIKIDFRGFLTMYQIISGLASWTRYWAVLRNGTIHFWKYPEDETEDKPTVLRINLADCSNNQLILVSREIYSHPFSFYIELTATPLLNDKTRILLSADSKDLCNAWIRAINETLDIMRG